MGRRRRSLKSPNLLLQNHSHNSKSNHRRQSNQLLLSNQLQLKKQNEMNLLQNKVNRPLSQNQVARRILMLLHLRLRMEVQQQDKSKMATMTNRSLHSPPEEAEDTTILQYCSPM